MVFKYLKAFKKHPLEGLGSYKHFEASNELKPKRRQGRKRSLETVSGQVLLLPTTQPSEDKWRLCHLATVDSKSFFFFRVLISMLIGIMSINYESKNKSPFVFIMQDLGNHHGFPHAELLAKPSLAAEASSASAGARDALGSGQAGAHFGAWGSGSWRGVSWGSVENGKKDAWRWEHCRVMQSSSTFFPHKTCIQYIVFWCSSNGLCIFVPPQ